MATACRWVRSRQARRGTFQTERAITILNTIVGNWGTTMFPAGGGEGVGLGAPQATIVPARFSIALRWRAVEISFRSASIRRDPANARFDH